MSDEAGRKFLVAAFEALTGVLDARTRHGLSDPRVVRSRDAATQALRRHLDAVGWTVVSFRDGAVLSDGSLVLADTGSVALAATLEGVGVAGLSIEKHAVQGELDALVELLTRDWTGRSVFEEDLTSAVWRHDFQNVHVDLLDADAIEEGHVPAALAQLRRGLMEGQTGSWPLFRPNAEVSQQLPVLQAEGGQIDLDLGAGQLDSLDRSLLERELERIAEGLDVDDDQVAQVLFETVRLETDPGRAERLGVSVARLALDRLAWGDTAGMACLVRRVLVLSRPPVRGHYDQIVAFQRGLATCLDESGRARILAGLDQLDDPMSARGDLFLFLTAMPADSAEAVARLAYACSWMDISQTIADALLTVLGVDRTQLRTLLERDEDELALAPLLAYSRLSATQVLGACLLRTRSHEARIREAALRSCRHHTDPRVVDAALDLLDDDDSQVRIEALRHVAMSRVPRAAHVVAQRLDQPMMERVSETELKAWLMTYGMVARGDAVEPLVDLLMDRKTIAGRHPRLKSFAVRGLMATGSKRAQDALNDVARKVPEVRDTIRELRLEMARR